MAEEEAQQALQKEEQINEKIKNEEYKIWKKQSPFLYDLCLTKTLDSMPVSVQWLPDVTPFVSSSDFYKQYTLLLGSRAISSDSNYIYQCLVDIPNSNCSGEGKLLNYVTESKRIVTEREPNLIRYAPQNPQLCASIDEQGSAYVFNMERFGNDARDGGFHPTLTLASPSGQSKPLRGLAWSPKQDLHVAACGADGTVSVWDVKSNLQSSVGSSVNPKWTGSLNGIALNTLTWSHFQPTTMAVGAEDGSIALFDARENKTTAKSCHKVHEQGVNALDFHPNHENLLLSGGSDGCVKVLDIRNYSTPFREFHGHSLSVDCVKWSPHMDMVFASGGADRNIKLWDLSREDADVDLSEGPAELVFIHGGHISPICDFDWHPTMPWTIASVAEDNIVEVWKVASAIVDKDWEEDEE